MHVNLTKRYIDGLMPPEAGRLYLRDSKTPGLLLAITPSGHKSFYCYRKVNGRPERILLGPWPDLTVENARKAAAVVNGRIAKGENPQADRRKARGTMTLKALFELYLASAKQHKKTWKADEWQFDKYLAKWKSRRLFEIRTSDVQALHIKLGEDSGKYTANRVLALISALFNFAIEKHDYEKANPTRGIDRFDEHKRDRFLTPDELPKFFAAVEAEPNEGARDFILLALFTGARRGNVQSMRWEEIDLGRAVWRIPDTKNGEPLDVVLTAEALKILKRRQAAANGSPWVFPSWSKTGHITEPKTAWAAVLERAGISNLRIHDLRRSLGSWQAITGASLPVIGKSLGHRNQSTTAIYSRLTLEPVRESVSKAAAAMIAVWKPKPKRKARRAS
jgi:integrase